MAKHPTEIFGFACNSNTSFKYNDKDYWCPYINQECNKKSRLIMYPMGVCSVKYGNDIIALCPNRFLENSIVFKNIADHYFKNRDNLLLFKEVGLPSVGNFDYALVKHKAMSNQIEDFVLIEFQTGQTTGTGKLVNALEDALSGQYVDNKNYSFGLNMADIWKRTLTQVLTKGILAEKWNNKIYWVLQKSIYNNLVGRYHLGEMKFNNGHNTIFMIYDLFYEDQSYKLKPTKTESTTTNFLFEAFQNNIVIPPKEAFIKKLTNKINSNLQLNLHIVKE